MGEKTAIEWCGRTLNIASGCTKQSEGCLKCYIPRTPPFRMNGRKFDAPGIGGKTGVILHPQRLTEPLRWRTPQDAFINSLSDTFHRDIPDEYLAKWFAVMIVTPQHTYKILTKRTGRMRSLLSSERFWRMVSDELGVLLGSARQMAPLRSVPPWIWLGVSVENQKWANVRIPLLLDTPAATRFLSCEPLLGPVDLTAVVGMNVLSPDDTGHENGLRVPGPAIDWVICGGESGPGYRPFDPDWARSLRDQCQAADVAFFFKQHGGATSKAGGRELDGREWSEFPKVT